MYYYILFIYAISRRCFYYTVIHIKYSNMEDISIMADQSIPLERAIIRVFNSQSLTCGSHLYKNVVKYTNGKIYFHSNNLVEMTTAGDRFVV